MKQYGVVQDDGTVTEYATEAKAERAGRIEALVVRSGDGPWIYPANGREFSPGDVVGLSPATASSDVERLLAPFRRRTGGQRSGIMVVSHQVPGNSALMLSSFHLLKCENWQRLSREIHPELEKLSGVVSVELDWTEMCYNYFRFTVIRRRSTAQ